MRFIIAQEFYQQMVQVQDHTPDCYVRPGEYLHHLYVDGVKFTVAQAVEECLRQATERTDVPAPHHLHLHLRHYQQLYNHATRDGGSLEGVQLLGDPPPPDE